MQTGGPGLPGGSSGRLSPGNKTTCVSSFLSGKPLLISGPLSAAKRRKFSLTSPLLRSSGAFAAAGIGFVVATLIFGRQLSQDAFGEAVLIIAICFSAVQAAPAGINALVVRYDLAMGWPVARVIVASGIVFAAAACLTGSLIYKLDHTALLVIAVTVSLGTLATGAVSSLQRMQQFGRATLVSQSGNAGLMLAALIMLGGAGLTPWFPATLTAAAFAISGLMAWYLILASPPPGRPLEARRWVRGVNFGGLAVTGELMAQGERLLIPLLLTYNDLAHFAVVATIALAPFRVLEMGALGTMAPRLRKTEGWANRRKLLLIDLVVLAVLTTLAGLAIQIIGPWICRLFAPSLEFPTALLTAVMVSGYGRVVVAFTQGIASAFGTAEEITRMHALGWVSVGISVLMGALLSSEGLAGLIYGVAIGWFFKAAAIFALTSAHLHND
jgi:hypothetical protein